MFAVAAAGLELADGDFLRADDVGGEIFLGVARPEVHVDLFSIGPIRAVAPVMDGGSIPAYDRVPAVPEDRAVHDSELELEKVVVVSRRGRTNRRALVARRSELATERVRGQMAYSSRDVERSDGSEAFDDPCRGFLNTTARFNLSQ